MKRMRITGVFFFVLGFVVLLASTGESRVIKGTTVSNSKKLVASAVAKNGAALTVPVRVTKTVTLPSGKKQFTGQFSMNVKTGRKVMMVFSTKQANGVQKAKTVATFATGAGKKKTTQFNVTPPPKKAAAMGALAAAADINLGTIDVGNTTAAPSINPLGQVDSDGDGTPDLTDNDDDNDGIADAQDTDSDGNGVIDTTEDMDTDNDGLPNTIDPDDDNDGLTDSVDTDDNGNGIPDSIEVDSDDDGVPDSTDPDNDNDGIPDSSDTDANGDGIPDSQEGP